ncbi:MAG: ABC transporter substrate-binding protein, partial [Actinomycetota bacterium]
MIRKPIRLVAGLALVGLLGVVAVAPAGATTRAQSSTQGVTDDEIEIVALVSDLDGLRAKFGNVFSEKLTTGNLLKRWQSIADDYGPINGRKIVVKPAVWDPTSNATFEKACTQATQDNKPFVVVNGNGFRASSLGCIAVDNQTPVFFGESVYGALQKAAGDNLFSLAPPAELAGLNAVKVTKEQGLVKPSSKIGILSSNEPSGQAAGNAVEAEAKKLKLNVASKVEVNGLAADPNTINKESAAAVATMKAAGVDTVFVVIPFTSSKGFYTEAASSNAGFQTILVDASSSMCTVYGATQLPGTIAGTPCVTTFDARTTVAKDGVKKDSAFEASCRKQFDATFNEKSQAGAPAGDTKPINGVVYVEDFAPNECTIMQTLLPAIKKAGKKLTWAKVAAQLKKDSKVPTAYMSGGTGSFGAKKQYLADKVHLLTLAAADDKTAKDAAGLFNG